MVLDVDAVDVAVLVIIPYDRNEVVVIRKTVVTTVVLVELVIVEVSVSTGTFVLVRVVVVVFKSIDCVMTVALVVATNEVVVCTVLNLVKDIILVSVVEKDRMLVDVVNTLSIRLTTSADEDVIMEVSVLTTIVSTFDVDVVVN